MTKDEHNKLLNIIKTKVTDAEILNTLVDLEQDYTTMISSSEELNSTIETITKERDDYAKLNNKLWLQQTVTTELPNESEENSNEEPPKLNYEDLEEDFKEE